MAERNAQFLQISFGHIGQDLEIDSILDKDGCVLGEADPIKPSQYLVVGAQVAYPSRDKIIVLFPSSLSAATRNGRFVPIGDICSAAAKRLGGLVVGHNSNLVGSMTARSSALSPLRIFPA
jgi:hypothetical protein